VIYPGSTPVGNATLVVANVLTCNKHTPKYCYCSCCSRVPAAVQAISIRHLTGSSSRSTALTVPYPSLHLLMT
jgi:hypothetical protein